MSDAELVEAAARNNAEWCAAVCRSHGIGSRFADECWVSDREPPSFYPRLVSLTADPVHLKQAILTHRPSATLEPWAVKDSFGVLDAGAKREKLFDAYWYARRPGAPAGRPGRASVVESAAALTQWVAAWGETPPGESIFVPDLLAEPGVTFLHDGGFQAGLVAYRSRGATNLIGVTNIFGDGDERDGCLAWLIESNPDCAIAGYGPEDEAASLAGLGFRVIAPLTVWLASG